MEAGLHEHRRHLRRFIRVLYLSHVAAASGRSVKYTIKDHARVGISLSRTIGLHWLHSFSSLMLCTYSFPGRRLKVRRPQLGVASNFTFEERLGNMTYAAASEHVRPLSAFYDLALARQSSIGSWIVFCGLWARVVSSISERVRQGLVLVDGSWRIVVHQIISGRCASASMSGDVSNARESENNFVLLCFLPDGLVEEHTVSRVLLVSTWTDNHGNGSVLNERTSAKISLVDS